MSLIQTFAPHPDESGRGYYRRLSSSNALSSWKDLARHCAERVTHDALFAHPEQTAIKLGLEPAWCAAATAQDNAARGWTGLRRYRRDAVCVHCLRESAHLRATWEHAYVAACPSHGVLLRDTCSGCATPLRDGREHIELCDCGFDLRAMPTEPATSAQMWVSSLLERGIAQIENFGPALSNTDIDVGGKLIGTLCKQPDPKVAARRSNAAAPSTMDGLVAFLSPLEFLLSKWPTNFRHHVSERLRVGPPEGRTLNRRLGAWYRQLRKLCDHTAIHPFLHAIADVAQAEFDGVLGRDAAAKVINREAVHVSLLEAAARIGIQYSSLQHFRDKGEVKCKELKARTNGYVYQIAVSEVDAIIAARAMWTSEKQACELLGVPPSVLGHLCDAGVVVREASWKEDLRKGGPIEVASIRRLTECLQRAAAEPAAGEGRRIAVRELTARYVGDKKALASAFQAIASGAVSPVKGGRLAGDYEYLWDDVAKHYARPALDQGLTLQALSEATGYKHESIGHWIAHGFLRCFEVLLRGQPCRVVTPNQLADFRREYLPFLTWRKFLVRSPLPWSGSFGALKSWAHEYCRTASAVVG
ncbi:TniQ family protein [Variovorax ureilyticus]|uniref:TniQ family protein n=1 Tax=Variovorax ureilyticus TaxID=1836198 RepID=UPI003D66CD45